MKLALSGLAGVEEFSVAMGSALVAYDARRITPSEIVAAIERAGPFVAEVRVDRAQEEPWPNSR